jgi:spore germination protein
MEQGYKFTGKIAEDKGAMQKIFANCDDILQRDMTLGARH